jgi:hypothetical protein
MNNVACSNITSANTNPAPWSPLNNGLSGFQDSVVNTLQVASLNNSEFLIAGGFFNNDGTATNFNNIALWNPTTQIWDRNYFLYFLNIFLSYGRWSHWKFPSSPNVHQSNRSR